MNTNAQLLPQLTLLADEETLYKLSPLGKRLIDHESETTRWLGLALANVWYGYEQQLSRVPIVQKLEDGSVTIEDYRSLLVNMRQQVMEGARWITRAASSMDVQHALLRNALITHAAQEHKDYEMLEKNYLAVGGDVNIIRTQPKNIGTEALSAYVFHVSSQPNPVELFGATFIVEGMGSLKAGNWAKSLMKKLNLSQEDTSFLYYHGVNDEDHYENLIKILASPYITPTTAVRLVKVAKTVGRLYALQLEELDNV